MFLKVIVQTIIIWGVVFVALLLAQNTQSQGLAVLTKTVAGSDLGLTFAASAAVGVLGLRTAAIPLVILVLLLQFPFPAMTDLATAMSPIGLGLLLGAHTRGLIVDGRRRANDSDQRTEQKHNDQ